MDWNSISYCFFVLFCFCIEYCFLGVCKRNLHQTASFSPHSTAQHKFNTCHCNANPNSNKKITKNCCILCVMWIVDIEWVRNVYISIYIRVRYSILLFWYSRAEACASKLELVWLCSVHYYTLQPIVFIYLCGVGTICIAQGLTPSLRYQSRRVDAKRGGKIISRPGCFGNLFHSDRLFSEFADIRNCSVAGTHTPDYAGRQKKREKNATHYTYVF